MNRKCLSLPVAGMITVVLLIAGCKPSQNKATYHGVPVSQIETELNSLLNNYYPRIVDTIHGGYWTNFENDWSRSKDQEKMLVTQARGLWTASRAAELFPENKVFRQAADHGYQFLTRQMWDTVNGGFYQYYFTDSVQKTDASFKLTYGNAFALYGLAQYAKINKDTAVLMWVRKSFNWLESEVHDPLYKGYFNISIPKATPDESASSMDDERRSGWGNPKLKDQNTSIHLMEALTAAYQVLPEELIKTRLEEMLTLIRDTMTDKEGYLHLFFSAQWEPLSIRDSSRNYITMKPELDHISFGHNIETAYLLTDASQTLYGSIDSLTLSVSKNLMDHTIRYGFDKDYYGLFDKGYKFPPDNKVEIIDSSKVWWAQAEAWHSLALFSDLYPDNRIYPDAFAKMWNYIQKELIDHTHGGWYNSGLDADPNTIKERKAHAWKGCYHDGRALMEVMILAKKPAIK